MSRRSSTPAPTLPFSHRVNVAHVYANPFSLSLEADAKECAALAREWQAGVVRSFKADLHIAPWKKDGVRITGSVRVHLEMPCVVTLEPVEQMIDEAVEALFVPEGSKLARLNGDDNGEILVEPDGPDMPEPFAGDTVDVGMAAVEFAALAIDHFPRKAGAALPDAVQAGDEGEDITPAFAALRDWKHRRH